jgi:streptogramin lyase
MRRFTVIACIAAALPLTITAAAASAAPAVNGEFALTDSPRHLALGPDGNVWVALGGTTNDIARVAPDGTVTSYNPANVAAPVGITAGPDGNMWVTQTGGVARFSPADPGSAQQFTIAAIADARGIVRGPDGNLWTANGDKVLKIPPGNPAGFTEYTVAGMGARGIAAGSDGRLWVADFAGQRIVSVTTGGTPTPHPVGGGPQEVAAGPGGQVAYTNPGAMPHNVGRLVSGGSPLTTDTPMADPFGITLGTDGAYWIAQFATHNLGRLTTTGAYTTLGGLSAGSGPRFITAGAGNTLWVALETANKVARVTGVVADSGPGTSPTTPPADTTPPAISGLRLTSPTFRAVARAVSPAGRRAPFGTTISFVLSEAASVQMRFQRVQPGRLVAGRCVTPPRSAKRLRGCTRLVAAGTVRVSGVPGLNRRVFRGRIGGKALPPGAYRLVLTATDAAGNGSARATSRFRVVR